METKNKPLQRDLQRGFDRWVKIASPSDEQTEWTLTHHHELGTKNDNEMIDSIIDEKGRRDLVVTWYWEPAWTAKGGK